MGDVEKMDQEENEQLKRLLSLSEKNDDAVVLPPPAIVVDDNDRAWTVNEILADISSRPVDDGGNTVEEMHDEVEVGAFAPPPPPQVDAVVEAAEPPPPVVEAAAPPPNDYSSPNIVLPDLKPIIQKAKTAPKQ